MGPLSRWAVFNPKKAVAIWVLFMAVIFGASSAFAGDFNDSFEIPDTESTRAQQVLVEQFGGFGGSDDVQEATVVFGALEGKVTEPAKQDEIADILASLESNPSVLTVTSPFAAPEGQEADLAAQQEQAQAQGDPSADPAGTAGAFLAPVSADETVARAGVTFKAEDEVVATDDLKSFLEVIEAANEESETLSVGAAGSVLEFAGEEPGSTSEIVGVIIALVIMALMFGSIVAASLPIVTALFGLATGLTSVALFANLTDIPTFATVLATLIGLGVGIDYSLFVINRYKTAVDAGKDTKAAAIEAVNTSGRAVLFAGTTVIIALAGLFVLRVNFINGLALASMVAVFAVMLSALWLLPALLSWLGRRAFAIKVPWVNGRTPHPQGTFFARHGARIQKRPALVAVVSLIVMAIFAIPLVSLQQGFADSGGRAEGTPARVGYDLQTQAFGPGVNGPFIVVVELPEAGDLSGAAALAEEIQGTDNVAGATNPIPDNTEDPSAATAAIISVYPESAPQDQATTDLLDTLRDEVIPGVEAETGITASVGGAKAIIVDFGSVLSDKLPLFLLVVVGLGILMLTVLFRSIVVPVVGALASLLSYGAALGVTVAVFQWGWFADVVGLEATGPIAPFVPAFLFAILFGLSMDYQVFLVSRMQEEWSHTGDNRRSVRRGLAGSGRVVAAAAAIMASVFLGFVLGDDAQAKLFGLSLGVAILLDAFVVRLLLVPALMTVIGPANWWLPSWLDRWLPHFSVETDDEEFAAESALIEDVPDADDDLGADKASAGVR